MFGHIMAMSVIFQLQNSRINNASVLKSSHAS